MNQLYFYKYINLSHNIIFISSFFAIFSIASTQFLPGLPRFDPIPMYAVWVIALDNLEKMSLEV